MPTVREQPRWLIPTFAVLTVLGLVLIVLAIAAQVWLVVVAGVLGVIVSGLGWWNLHMLRGRSQAGGDER